MPLPVVAVVGRPNVGKSTLFNRMIGYRKSVIDDRPGVTRDRLYEIASLDDRDVLLIDTGGIEPAPGSDLEIAMRRQSLVAVEEADVIVFVMDAVAGFTPADAEVAQILRRSGKPLIAVVNKVDGEKHEPLIADFYTIGFEPLIPVSAAHGRGVWDLTEAILSLLPEAPATDAPSEDIDDFAEDAPEDGGDPEVAADEDDEPSEIRVAVVGRPNMGKSTLINKLVGSERLVVSDVAGTTMDPVDSALEVDGRRYVFVDTAGVRRRNRIDTQLERFVSLRSIRAIERCHVALLLIDGVEGPTDQDAKLAQLIVERGRALILLVNKWDLAREAEEVNSHKLEDALGIRMPHVTWAPHIFVSAKTGKGLHRVLPTVDAVYRRFTTRQSTATLNRFLTEAVAAHHPPQRYHHPVRLYYMTQVRVRPPTFVAFANSPEGVGEAYERYLVNQLRESFDLEGVPVRLSVRRRRKIGEEA